MPRLYEAFVLVRTVVREQKATRINGPCLRPLDTWQLVALVYMATFRWE